MSSTIQLLSSSFSRVHSFLRQIPFPPLVESVITHSVSPDVALHNLSAIGRYAEVTFFGFKAVFSAPTQTETCKWSLAPVLGIILGRVKLVFVELFHGLSSVWQRSLPPVILESILKWPRRANPNIDSIVFHTIGSEDRLHLSFTRSNLTIRNRDLMA